MTNVQEFSRSLKENIAKVIVGKEEVIELLLVALLCEGHVLLDDVPGVGKTMLARSLAISLGGTFKRLQCTPDLLPNDITGVSIYNQSNMDFEFRPGPVFVNILLSDEINRATPRTQSALLEAMQEQQVTVDGKTHLLPRPFIVIATENPIDFEGTFPLPEAQLDRFMLQLSLGYPTPVEEKQILRRLLKDHPISKLSKVNEIDDVQELKRIIWEVNVDDTIIDYIVALIDATRHHQHLTLGASPRAALALIKGSQALAALRGRDYVIPDDIKYLFLPTITHRLIIKPESAMRDKNASSILKEIKDTVPVPLETK
ncbi:MAG: MoxR family ATPase [Anaerolineaceae bacterium]|nr:MoxR family ATPase [Anaerolineaceae bacterium]